MTLEEGYEISYDKKFDDWIKKNLPHQYKKVLDRKLKYFRENPNHPSLNTKPYSGLTDKTKKQLGIDEVYEFYINRKGYRCLLYVIHETKEIIIVFIGNHDQIHRFIKDT